MKRKKKRERKSIIMNIQDQIPHSEIKKIEILKIGCRGAKMNFDDGPASGGGLDVKTEFGTLFQRVGMDPTLLLISRPNYH